MRVQPCSEIGRMEKKNPVSVFSILLGLSIALISCNAEGPKRVLFLGNSVWDFEGGVHQPFLGFCETAGLDFKAISQMKTREHSHGVEFLDFGRIPLSLPEVAGEERISSIIGEGGYDYVIVEARRSGYLLPDWAGLPKDRGSSIAFEQNLEALGEIHRAIVESGAQTVLYMHPGHHTLERYRLPVAQMYGRLHRGLEKLEIGGKRHEVNLVPASFLWGDAVKKYGVEGWYANPGHGNALARFASGCMLYTYLTGKNPSDNSFTELPLAWDQAEGTLANQVSKEDAEWIKNQVWLYYSTGRN